MFRVCRIKYHGPCQMDGPKLRVFRIIDGCATSSFFVEHLTQTALRLLTLSLSSELKSQFAVIVDIYIFIRFRLILITVRAEPVSQFG